MTPAPPSTRSPAASGEKSWGTLRDMSTNSDDDNIEIIGSGGMAGDDDLERADGKSLTDLVEQPAKVMRIGTMIKQLLVEPLPPSVC